MANKFPGFLHSSPTMDDNISLSFDFSSDSSSHWSLQEEYTSQSHAPLVTVPHNDIFEYGDQEMLMDVGLQYIKDMIMDEEAEGHGFLLHEDGNYQTMAHHGLLDDDKWFEQALKMESGQETPEIVTASPEFSRDQHLLSESMQVPFDYLGYSYGVDNRESLPPLDSSLPSTSEQTPFQAHASSQQYLSENLLPRTGFCGASEDNLYPRIELGIQDSVQLLNCEPRGAVYSQYHSDVRVAESDNTWTQSNPSGMSESWCNSQEVLLNQRMQLLPAQSKEMIHPAAVMAETWSDSQELLLHQTMQIPIQSMEPIHQDANIEYRVQSPIDGKMNLAPTVGYFNNWERLMHMGRGDLDCIYTGNMDRGKMLLEGTAIPYTQIPSVRYPADGNAKEKHRPEASESCSSEAAVAAAVTPAICRLSATISDSTSYVQNKDLKAERTAKLHRDGPLPVMPKYSRSRGPGNGNPPKQLHDSDTIDLKALLVGCAKVVGRGDWVQARVLLEEVRPHTSPQGNAMQRLGHYFMEALVARLSGTGIGLYMATNNFMRPAAAKIDILKAYRVFMEGIPFMKLSHFFANQNILKAAKGASRLHIVDYGILFGFQWPYLISALAEQRGGPPFLRITGIDYPQSGAKPAERIEQTGKRLVEYAKTYGVLIEYCSIAREWERIDADSLNLRSDETLVVNCLYRLKHLMDETAGGTWPRKAVLDTIRKMNPKVFTVGEDNAGLNAPIFLSRFRDALYFFSGLFDMFDTVLCSDNPERLILEKELKGREILNIVACEGMERVERPETHRQWQARLQRAGFMMQKQDPILLKKAQTVCKSYYNRDFMVEEGNNWMLLGWKGRIMQALSAWQVADVGKY